MKYIDHFCLWLIWQIEVYFKTEKLESLQSTQMETTNLDRKIFRNSTDEDMCWFVSVCKSWWWTVIFLSFYQVLPGQKLLWRREERWQIFWSALCAWTISPTQGRYLVCILSAWSAWKTFTNQNSTKSGDESTRLRCPMCQEDHEIPKEGLGSFRQDFRIKNFLEICYSNNKCELQLTMCQKHPDKQLMFVCRTCGAGWAVHWMQKRNSSGALRDKCSRKTWRATE